MLLGMPVDVTSTLVGTPAAAIDRLEQFLRNRAGDTGADLATRRAKCVLMTPRPPSPPIPQLLSSPLSLGFLAQR